MTGRSSRTNLAKIGPQTTALSIHLMASQATSLAAKEGSTCLCVSLHCKGLRRVAEGLDEGHELPQLFSIKEEERHFGARDSVRDRVDQILVSAARAKIGSGQIGATAARAITAMASETMGAEDAAAGGKVFRSRVRIWSDLWPLGLTRCRGRHQEEGDKKLHTKPPVESKCSEVRKVYNWAVEEGKRN